MNAPYRYPITINTSFPLQGKMADLVMESLRHEQQKRNRHLITTVPSTLVFFGLLFLIFRDKAWIPILILTTIFGSYNACAFPFYQYSVSEDQTNAKIELKRRHSLVDFIKANLPDRNPARQSLEGAVEVIIEHAVQFICLIALMPFSPFVVFDNLFWLKDYKQLCKALIDGPQDQERQHIRGTKITPPVQLAGSAPTQEPPALPPQPLEVLGGALTLNPDGGIVISGGTAFDRKSTFANFSINGVAISRQSEELLTASQDGSEYSFRFDGNSWAEI